MFRKLAAKSMMLLLVVGSLVFAGSAMAATYDASLHGYTFMGGGMAYTDVDSGKNYFLAQPLYYDSDGENYGGYGWVSISIGTETVTSATLDVELLGIGAMTITDPTEESPAILDIYSTSVDVTTLYSDSTLRKSLFSTLDGDTIVVNEALSLIVNDYTMEANGDYSIDITEFYNACVASGITGLNLIFSANDNGDGTKYSTNVAITTSTVPVPGTLSLLGVGLIGLVGLRRRS